MPSEIDPRRYEQEVLREIRAYYSKPGAADDMLKFGHRRFLDARLEGDYPETALVVTYKDEDTDVEREVQYRLWGDNWTVEDPSGRRHRRSPQGLVNFLTADLDAPGEPMGR